MAIIVAGFDLLLGLKFVRSVLQLAAWEHAAYVINGSSGSQCGYTDEKTITQG